MEFTSQVFNESPEYTWRLHYDLGFIQTPITVIRRIVHIVDDSYCDGNVWIWLSYGFYDFNICFRIGSQEDVWLFCLVVIENSPISDVIHKTLTVSDDVCYGFSDIPAKEQKFTL